MQVCLEWCYSLKPNMKLQCVSVALAALLVVAEANVPLYPISYGYAYSHPVSGGVWSTPYPAQASTRSPYYPASSYAPVGYYTNPSVGYYPNPSVNQGSAYGYSDQSSTQGLSPWVRPYGPINGTKPLPPNNPNPPTAEPWGQKPGSNKEDRPFNVMLCFYYGDDNPECVKTRKN